jgi:hypothetical protein
VSRDVPIRLKRSRICLSHAANRCHWAQKTFQSWTVSWPRCGLPLHSSVPRATGVVAATPVGPEFLAEHNFAPPPEETTSCWRMGTGFSTHEPTHSGPEECDDPCVPPPDSRMHDYWAAGGGRPVTWGPDGGLTSTPSSAFGPPSFTEEVTLNAAALQELGRAADATAVWVAQTSLSDSASVPATCLPSAPSSTTSGPWDGGGPPHCCANAAVVVIQFETLAWPSLRSLLQTPHLHGQHVIGYVPDDVPPKPSLPRRFVHWAGHGPRPGFPLRIPQSLPPCATPTCHC